MQILTFRQAQRAKIYRAVVKRNPELARELLNDASQDLYRTRSKAAKAEAEPQENPANEDWMPETRTEREALIWKMLRNNPLRS